MMPGPALSDRVKQTTTTTGTGTVNLDGAAPSGFVGFVAALGSGTPCYYEINDNAGNWEIGIGTATSGAPDTLSRDTILRSTNGNAAVSFAAGTKDVFICLPATMMAADHRFSGTTSNGSPTELFLGAGATRLVLPNNSIWTYDAYLTARRSDVVGSYGGWRQTGVVARGANAASTTLLASQQSTFYVNASYSFTFSPDVTNGSLKLTVTGVVGHTVHWAGRVCLVEAT